MYAMSNVHRYQMLRVKSLGMNAVENTKHPAQDVAQRRTGYSPRPENVSTRKSYVQPRTQDVNIAGSQEVRLEGDSVNLMSNNLQSEKTCSPCS